MTRITKAQALVTILLGTSSSSSLAFAPLVTRPTVLSSVAPAMGMTSPQQSASLLALRSDPNDMIPHHQHLTSLDQDTTTEETPFGTEVEMETTQERNRTPINPTPALVDAWQKSALSQKPSAALLALSLMMATTFSAFNNPAYAAMSGGRVGGGGYSRSAPSMSRPAPRSYSSGGSYSYGYNRPRSNIYIGPTVVSPFGSPFITPFSPFMPFSPYGAGVAVARGPSFFDFLFFGAVALVIANTVRGFGQAASDTFSSSPWSDIDDNVATPLGRGTTVAQVSVALQVPNRDDPQSILKVLPRLANSVNTDRRSGLQNLTSQVALELLRRKSQITSASTSHQHFRDSTKAQQSFGQKSIKERSKFEKEGFSKWRGTDWGSVSPKPASDGSGQATMAVVTLLIEIDGDSTKLPSINSLENVEEALRKIASDSRVGECLQSAEILWTPEDRNEILSSRDVVVDYPELRQI